VLARRAGIGIDSARQKLVDEARREPGGDDANQVRAAAAWARVGLRQVMKSPLLYAQIHLTGVAVALGAPLPGTALATYFGAAIPQDLGSAIPNFVKLMASLKPAQAVRALVEDRLANMPPTGIVLFVFAILYQLAFLLLSAIGVIGSPRRIGWYLWTFLLVTTVYFIAWPGAAGESRFRIPVEPLIAAFAALGLRQVIKPRAGTRSQPR
jgi:hypothetical protein